MKKFIYRLVFILFAGILVWGISQGRISDIPGYDYVVAFLWGGVVVMAALALGKRKGWWILLLSTFLWQTTPYSAMAASSVQSYYPTYCAKIERARQNHWKGDEACDEEVLEEARYITSKQKGAASDSTLPSLDCSCSSEYECAKKVMQICSEYDRRHHLENEENKKVHTVLQILAKENSGCWPCDMAAVVFFVIQKLAFNLNSVMVEVAFMLLKLIFLGWIIFTGASAVFFPSKSTTFATQVLTRLICVVLVAIVLSTNGMTTLYSKFLNPVMNVGIGLSEKIADVALPMDTFGMSINNQVPVQTTSSSQSINYCQSSESNSFSSMMSGFLGTSLSQRFLSLGKNVLSSYLPGNNPTHMEKELSKQLIPLDISEDKETLLNDDMKKSLLCMTQKFYKQLNPFTAIGQSLVEFSRADETSTLGLKWPDIKMWVTGWLLVIIFTFFSFLVAFRMMDIFLRLGLFLVLIPWCVAAIAFPITRDFTKKGWSFFIHTIVEFLGLALAIGLSMKLFETVVSPDADSLKTAVTASYSQDYGRNLYNVIYSGGAGRFFFMLAVSAYFSFQILKMVTPVLEELFGVKGVSTGSIFGGIALSAMNRTRQITKKAADISNNTNIRFKSESTLKKEEIEGLKQELPQLQDEVNAKIIQHNALNKKSSLPTATEADRQKTLQAEQELQKARAKLAEQQAKIAAAEAELKNMYLGFKQSSASFAPRRYAENSANALHYFSQKTAGGIENVLVGGGQWLNKTGIGAIVGVPMVYAGKLLSLGLRGSTKTISTTVHAVGATPEAIKNTVSAVVHAPENLARGVVNGVKNTVETTKNVVGFTGHIAKKAVFDVPKDIVIGTVKAPGAVLKETANVVGFTGHMAKKAVYDAPKAVVQNIVNTPQNIVQGVKNTAEATKDVVGFTGHLTKRVVVDAPKSMVKGVVMAPVNLTKKVASAGKAAVRFPVDLAKKIFK